MATCSADLVGFKIKLAQAVDHMEFNLDELLAQIPRARTASPSILTFMTRAREARVVENIDSLIPDSFRVYYKEGKSRVCPPRGPPLPQAPQACARPRASGRRPADAAAAGTASSGADVAAPTENAAWCFAAETSRGRPTVRGRSNRSPFGLARGLSRRQRFRRDYRLRGRLSPPSIGPRARSAVLSLRLRCGR